MSDPPTCRLYCLPCVPQPRGTLAAMIKFGKPISSDVEARLPRLIDSLASDERIEAVWLFRSRPRNEADQLSDVDIAVRGGGTLDARALSGGAVEGPGLATGVLGSPSRP